MKNILLSLYNPQTAIGLIIIAVTAGVVVMLIGRIFRSLFSRSQADSQRIEGDRNVQINRSKNIWINEKKGKK